MENVKPSPTHADKGMETVKIVVRRLYDAQQQRIAAQNRIARLVREGVVPKEHAESIFAKTTEMEVKLEKMYERIVAKELKGKRIMSEWLSKVKGIGPRLAGLLIANIGTPVRFANPSKLWAYCGLHVVDGRAVRRKKGQKANWNAELKTTAFKIATSFIKAGDSPYNSLYYAYRDRIIAREVDKGNTIWRAPNPKETEWPKGTKWILEHRPDKEKDYSGDKTMLACDEGRIVMTTATMGKDGKAPDWTYGRIHAMAMRYVAKIFLSHLWEVWYTIETGKPAPCAVYVLDCEAGDCKNHTHKIDPWSMISS